MKTLLFLAALDLAQPSESFLGKVLWVLEGHTDYLTEPPPGGKPQRVHRYWATEGTVRAALAWALAGAPAENPQAAAWSMLHADVGLVDRAFRARFGVPLVKRRRGAFTEYDAEGLRTAFHAVYLPPSPRTHKLYEPFKSFVAESARAAAYMLSHRAQ